jgi:hypothetical protein
LVVIHDRYMHAQVCALHQTFHDRIRLLAQRSYGKGEIGQAKDLGTEHVPAGTLIALQVACALQRYNQGMRRTLGQL